MQINFFGELILKLFKVKNFKINCLNEHEITDYVFKDDKIINLDKNKIEAITEKCSTK